MSKSLKPYREARITKAMLIVGIVMDLLLFIITFILMAKPGLA